MLAIYLRPDKTQILEGSIQKNLHFAITSFTETDPALSYLLEDNQEDNFCDFLSQLKRDTHISRDDVYIVLPDYLFAYIDSVDYINDVNLKTTIREHTNIPPEKLYITMPVATKSPAPERQSVYAIQKVYIDRLVAAATQERIALTSVEPASLSFYRAFGEFNEEMPLVEIFPEHASIVTYSPAGGIFLSDAPTITEKRLSKCDEQQANQMVRTAFSANDFAAGQVYMELNTDMPYYLLCDKKSILDLEEVQLRKPEQQPVFRSFIRTDMDPDLQMEWMPVLGTLLQAYSDMDDKYQDMNPVYENKVAYVLVKSGNLLPDMARQAARNRQWKSVIKRVSKGVSAVCGAVIVVEAAACLLLSSTHIDPSLKADYDQAQNDLKSIKEEAAILSEADQEQQRIMDTYHILTLARPDGCGFSEVTIGSSTPERDKGAVNYLDVTAVATDEMLMEQLRSNLSYQSDFFSNPSVSTIKVDASSGLKVADISAIRELQDSSSNANQQQQQPQSQPQPQNTAQQGKGAIR